MSAPLSASKKCPHCGHWSEWQQRPDDRCARCGQLLDPVRNRSEQAREQQAQEPISGIMLIEINPEDGALLRFFKYIIRGGQLAFAALLAFMLWLVTALAG
ncbi:hypothetical protein [Hymenobacter sp. DG25A]|jgi:hypothetical protein|uniref:hypothetical protein n=1 Tax=Hymenobacter sp. DG25A TaxID=1385663 RepID=UPI000A70407A|nr:hypothetical protein [Hymenobacter sp. DG25A]